MTRLVLLSLAIICNAYAVPFRINDISKLKVMSFNIWRSGSKINDGLRKAAEQIKYVDPDVVALQEAQDTPDIINRLVKMLGSGWSGVQHCSRHLTDVGGQAIVTKHDIIGYDHTRAGMNLRIRLKGSGREIYVWAMHLHYNNYGPDKTRERILSAEAILRGEFEQNAYHGRLYNIFELIKHPKFIEQMKNSDNVPVIVAGDFNTPSDLDYTGATKNSHYGYVIQFPVTKVLREVAAMTDSYRQAHPNPVTHPGGTWPLYAGDKDDSDTPRIKDRIDYIFYRGPLTVVKSETFSGTTRLVDDRGTAWKNNDFPGDHFAVITEFETSLPPQLQPSFEIPKEYAAFDHSYSPLPECSLNIVH